MKESAKNQEVNAELYGSQHQRKYKTQNYCKSMVSSVKFVSYSSLFCAPTPIYLNECDYLRVYPIWW